MPNFLTTVNISAMINAPVQKVWDYYTMPEHIVQWNNASPDWHTPKSENDLRVGGKFLSRMEAKDGSNGFDFTGTYEQIEPLKTIAYNMDDGRHVDVKFISQGEHTQIDIAFDPETQNTIEQQRQGWQAILDNFKTYVEEN